MRISVRRVTALGWLALGASCASRTGEATRAGQAASTAKCEPVDSALTTARGPVFRECEVDRRAQAVGRLSIDFTPNRDDRRTCYSARIRFVVDAAGVPVPGTARIVRSNHSRFAEALLVAHASWRFVPAAKDGVPVAQLVETAHVAEVIMSTSPQPPRMPPARPSC